MGAERSDEIVIVAGGGPPHPSVAGRLAPDAFVIAADSGLEHAAALGLEVAVVVGDMDSVDPDALAAAAAAGTQVERHPQAKDATDVELALDLALDRRPRHVVVVTGEGDRLDHTLAVALLLATPRTAGVAVEGWLGCAHLTVVRDRADLAGTRGDLVTLLALHGPAEGVTTEGLLYPLDGETLGPGSSRGVSNEMLADDATVWVRSGVVVAVQPGAAGMHVLERGSAGG
jgi:thiamine pyrophosphokinase